jgi:hypothetical protein
VSQELWFYSFAERVYPSSSIRPYFLADASPITNIPLTLPITCGIL